MAEMITIKKLEEKYGWGWVVLQNPDCEDWATPQKGEYIFHSQDRKECSEKIKELPNVPLGVIFFGTHPSEKNSYPCLSLIHAAKKDAA